jgi:DNA-binding CsgD family transcriptional regulator
MVEKKKTTDLWQDVLASALKKEQKKLNSVNAGKPRSPQTRKTNNTVVFQKRNKRYYVIGEGDKKLYFTEREIDTMKSLLQFHTIPQAALHLGISARTLEFYVKNLRSKLSCQTKDDLIEYISKENFLKELKKDH